MNQTYSILLVDDNRPWRQDTARCLAGVGLVILDAGTGREAIEMARIHKPHASILDMHMPDMTGLEVMRLLKSEDLAAPWIMISADAAQEVRRKALEEGAFSFLLKPISPDLLKYTVDRALQSRFGKGPDLDDGPGR